MIKNTMAKFLKIIFNMLALSIVIFIGVDVFYKVLLAKISNVTKERDTILNTLDLKQSRRLPRAHYQKIVEKNIFRSIETEEKKEEKQVTKEIEKLEQTSLKISLIGTAVGNQKSSIAVITEEGKKTQDLYREGDIIQGAVIKDILRGRVVLSVGGRDEILTIEEGLGSRTEQDTPPTPPPPPEALKGEDTVLVSESDIQESLENIHQLLTQVRIRPHFRDGRPDGLAITRIKADSLFARLGLRNGDVIQGVDGRSIKSPDDAMEIYTKLKSGSEVNLQIRRHGKSKTLSYKFR